MAEFPFSLRLRTLPRSSAAAAAMFFDVLRGQWEGVRGEIMRGSGSLWLRLSLLSGVIDLTHSASTFSTFTTFTPFLIFFLTRNKLLRGVNGT